MAAKKRSAAPADGGPEPQRPGAGAAAALSQLVRTGLTFGGLTGRQLLVFRPGELQAGARALRDKAGVATVSTAEAKEGFIPPDELDGKGLVLDKLGIAVVELKERGQAESVSAVSQESAVVARVPERLLFLSSQLPGFPGAAWPAGPPSLDYWQGFRDALNQFLGRMAFAPLPAMPFGPVPPPAPFGGGAPYFPGPEAPTPFGPTVPSPVVTALGGDPDGNNPFTWGLQVTGVLTSQYTGAGVKVCVLDTGIDLAHPDFQGGRLDDDRLVSFVGDTVQDGNGHGTHCAGTAFGPKSPVGGGGKRYGVAPDAELFIGKVFPDSGSGNLGFATPEGIGLQAIEWAVAQGCRVVSMSFGMPAQGPVPTASIYDLVARRALAQNTILVAAAGNGSNRRAGILKPVDIPADSSAILAVAALTPDLQVANFSNRAFYPPAGAIDLAASGVDVYSSASLTGVMLRGPYTRASGTSMATPHVAGVIALACEQFPSNSGDKISQAVLDKAKALPLDPRDVGQGLVQVLG
jgi:subtilisin family serine protease